MSELKKSLSPLSVWALAFGCIIGGSAFFMPANTFLPQAGPLGTAVAMLLAAGVMIIIAFNYHFMVNKLPEAGGEFAYARDAFGRNHSFICAWFLGLSYISLIPLNATLIGVVGKHLIGNFFRFGYMYSVAGYDVYVGEVALSLSVVVIFAWLNVRGVKVSGWVQLTLAFSLLLGVATISLAAFVSPVVSMNSFKPLFPAVGNVWPGVLAVLAVSPWAFVGFDTIPQTAEEFGFPHTRTKMIMVLAILFGALIYVSLNTVTAVSIPPEYTSWVEYISDAKNIQGIDSLPTFGAANRLLGTCGLVFVGIAVAAAALAGVLGFMVAASRLLFAMARDGVLPKWFGRLHPKYATPDRAIIFIFLVSVVAPFFGRTVLVWVVDMSALGAAIGFAYTSAAACKLAILEKLHWQATFGAFGTLCSLVFAVLLLVPIKGLSCAFVAEEYCFLVSWIILGVVFYMVAGRCSRFETIR